MIRAFPARSARTAPFLACATLACALSACSDGGEGGGTFATADPAEPGRGTGLPADDGGAIAGAPGSVTAMLVTADPIGADVVLPDFLNDYRVLPWQCTSPSSGGLAHNYWFLDSGRGLYIRWAGTDAISAGPFEFEWRAIGPRSVRLSYGDIGAVEEISAVVFAGEDIWEGFSDSVGFLDCEAVLSQY